MKKQELAENRALVQKTLEQWLGFKRYLIKAFGEEPITQEDEASFLEIKSVVAREVRTLGERVKSIPSLDPGATIIRELSNRCVSVGHLRALPINDRRQLLKDWHGAFVRLSRVLGALTFVSEGYLPTLPGAKKKKGGGGKTAMIVVAVVVVVVILGVVGYSMM